MIKTIGADSTKMEFQLDLCVKFAAMLTVIMFTVCLFFLKPFIAGQMNATGEENYYLVSNPLADAGCG